MYAQDSCLLPWNEKKGQEFLFPLFYLRLFSSRSILLSAGRNGCQCLGLTGSEQTELRNGKTYEGERFLGLFTNRTFSWTSQYVLPLLNAASRIDASTVKLDSPAKTDGASILESYGEVTPRSGGFLAANDTAEVFLQSFIVAPLSFRFILAPKVSRYLSKSVLIL